MRYKKFVDDLILSKNGTITLGKHKKLRGPIKRTKFRRDIKGFLKNYIKEKENKRKWIRSWNCVHPFRSPVSYGNDKEFYTGWGPRKNTRAGLNRGGISSSRESFCLKFYKRMIKYDNRKGIAGLYRRLVPKWNYVIDASMADIFLVYVKNKRLDNYK